MQFPCLQLSDEVLIGLARACPQLRALSVSKNKTMSDRGMVPVAQQCKELHRLKIDECVFSSAVLLALSQFCTAMQVLDCSGCDNIPENSIKAAASALPLAERAVLYRGLRPKHNRVEVYYKVCSVRNARKDTVFNARFKFGVLNLPVLPNSVHRVCACAQTIGGAARDKITLAGPRCLYATLVASQTLFAHAAVTVPNNSSALWYQIFLCAG